MTCQLDASYYNFRSVTLWPRGEIQSRIPPKDLLKGAEEMNQDNTMMDLTANAKIIGNGATVCHNIFDAIMKCVIESIHFLQARAWQQRSKTNQSESHSQDYQTPSSKSHKLPIVNNPPKGQSFVDLSKKQSTKLPLILRSISNHLKTGWMLLPWSKPRKLWRKWERMRKAIGKNLQRASTGRRAKLLPQVTHLRRCLQIPAHPLKAPTTMLPPKTTTKRSRRRITSRSMGKRTGSISSRANKLNSWWRWQILQETTSEKHLEAWSAA